MCVHIRAYIVYVYKEMISTQKNTENKQQNTQTQPPNIQPTESKQISNPIATLKYLKLIYLYPPHPIPNLILVCGWTNPFDKFYTFNLRCISPWGKNLNMFETTQPHLPNLIWTNPFNPSLRCGESELETRAGSALSELNSDASWPLTRVT